MNLFDDYTALDNVMVGAAGVSRARLRHAPRGGRRRGFARRGRARCSPPSASPTRATFAPRTCPTASAARSRSPWRWRRRPRLLFLDEPTSGLGADGAQRLAELIGRLKGKLTIVVIEHDMASCSRSPTASR